MNSKKRYLIGQIINDLSQKMVFVGGPRQVGKTTMAKSLLKTNQSGYLSWDIAGAMLPFKWLGIIFIFFISHDFHIPV